MIQIQPIQFTTEGNIATQLDVEIISNDSISLALFGWTLYDSTGIYVDNGTIYCGGVDYSNWNGDDNYPYEFIMNTLGLSIS